MDLPDGLNFKEELIEWVAYYGLTEYLISRDIYYRFSGYFHIDGEVLFVSVSFEGPIDGENEELPELRLGNEEFELICGKEPLKHKIDQFDPDQLYINLEYDSQLLFTRFDVSYFDKEVEYFNFDLFYENHFQRLKSIVEKKIAGYLPQLIGLEELEVTWNVDCEDNVLTYRIHSDFYKINFDEIVNSTN